MKTPLITREGYENLKKKWIICGVKSVPRSPKVTWAASLGDRSENADYQYNKKRLREIDRRVRYLTKCLENLKIVDYSPQQEGKVFSARGLKSKTMMATPDAFASSVTMKFSDVKTTSLSTRRWPALLKKRSATGGCQHARRRSQLVRQQYRICEIARPEQSESLVSRLAFCRASPYNYP